MYGSIYKIVCTVNGKAYIGQTKRTLAQRWASHVYEAFGGNSDTKFSRAIRKYGAKAFRVYPLVRAENMAELNSREIFAIRIFETQNLGYNSSPGGNAGSMKAESRAKISKALKGRPKPEGHGEKVKIALTGKKHDLARRRNNSLAQIRGGKHVGKTHSQETKDLIREKNQAIAYKKWVKIVCIETGKIYACAQFAAQDLEVSTHIVKNHLNGNTKSVRGFTFKRV